jgi:hypothetical protein
LIERADPAPGGGQSFTGARFLEATVSRHNLDASDNVFRLAEIGFEEASPRMGGTAVSQTVVFCHVSPRPYVSWESASVDETSRSWRSE